MHIQEFTRTVSDLSEFIGMSSAGCVPRCDSAATYCTLMLWCSYLMRHKRALLDIL